jgi:Lrp/AsnC family transcriptional regulator for asnA, asnC and gidA
MKDSVADRKSDYYFESTLRFVYNIGMKLDELDSRVISELQRNPRLSDRQIAHNLAVNENKVRRRIKRLLESGVIVPTVLTNVLKLGYNVTTFIGLQVELSDMHDVAMKLAQYENIHLVALSSGTYNLILWAHFTSHEQLADFTTDILGKISGIVRAEPFIQLRYVKGFGQLMEPPIIHDQET